MSAGAKESGAPVPPLTTTQLSAEPPVVRSKAPWKDDGGPPAHVHPYDTAECGRVPAGRWSGCAAGQRVHR